MTAVAKVLMFFLLNMFECLINLQIWNLSRYIVFQNDQIVENCFIGTHYFYRVFLTTAQTCASSDKIKNPFMIYYLLINYIMITVTSCVVNSIINHRITNQYDLFINKES